MVSHHERVIIIFKILTSIQSCIYVSELMLLRSRLWEYPNFRSCRCFPKVCAQRGILELLIYHEFLLIVCFYLPTDFSFHCWWITNTLCPFSYSYHIPVVWSTGDCLKAWSFSCSQCSVVNEKRRSETCESCDEMCAVPGSFAGDACTVRWQSRGDGLDDRQGWWRDHDRFGQLCATRGGNRDSCECAFTSQWVHGRILIGIKLSKFSLCFLWSLTCFVHLPRKYNDWDESFIVIFVNRFVLPEEPGNEVFIALRS